MRLPGAWPQQAPQPVNVVVALDQQKADAGLPNSIIEKSDPVPALATKSINLAQDASFAAALKDDTADRYSFSSLFDGQDDTFLAITQADQELNILVTFKDGAAHNVTALEYTPPAGVDPTRMAASVDVMILPEGQLEASGRPVISFSLPQSSESRTFAIPGGRKARVFGFALPAILLPTRVSWATSASSARAWRPDQARCGLTA